MRRPARTARSGSSSWATGAPKIARTPSPARSLTVPSKDSITPIIRATASATISLSSSGSSRSPSAVEPTRSAKSAVTTRRSSRDVPGALSMEGIVGAGGPRFGTGGGLPARPGRASPVPVVADIPDASDHAARDVRDGAEPVLFRQDLLRDGDDIRIVTNEEAGRSNQVIGAPLRSLVLFGVCPGVLPGHQHDRWLRWVADWSADGGEVDRSFHSANATNSERHRAA